MIFWWFLTPRTVSHPSCSRVICIFDGDSTSPTEELAKKAWLEKQVKAMSEEDRAKHELSKQNLPKTKWNEESAKRVWLSKS